MCGRFTLTVDRVDTILRKFQAELAPDFQPALFKPNYNAAPGQHVPAIVAKEDGKRYLTNILWGIATPWAVKGKIPPQINVRHDTFTKNKFFRDRLTNNRCIFIADGFYEWQAPAGYEKMPLPRGVHKIPYRIVLKNDEVFPLAGVWRAIEHDGKTVLSGATITTEPNALMVKIHNRMPAILDEQRLTRWLDPSYKNYWDLINFLVPYSAGRMEAYEVSERLNSNRFNDKACIEMVGERRLRIAEEKKLGKALGLFDG